MPDERHPERRPSTDVPVPQNGGREDPWSEDLQLCMEAAELRATQTYRQIAEAQGVSVSTAFDRVKRWHTWMSRLSGLEVIRGQINSRYEWLWQQCLSQYGMLLRDARTSCRDHPQPVPTCAACQDAARNALTPWARVNLANQMLLRMADLVERMARLHGLQQDAAAQINVAAMAQAQGQLGGGDLVLPDEPGAQEFVARALRLVRRSMDPASKETPRLPG